MSKSSKFFFYLFTLLIVSFILPTICYAQDAPSEAFLADIQTLENRGRLTEQDWTYHKLQDFQAEYASRFNYRYDIALQNIKNFVVKATISWETASPTPEWNFTGCGFIFRMNDYDYMQASIYADGLTRVVGRKGIKPLTYGRSFYDLHSPSGTKDVVLSVSDYQLTMMVDGRIVMKRTPLATALPGDFGFYTGSGTNYDFGTRCTFSNVEVYTWD